MMSKPIRVLYLDDCEIDHRLLDAYLRLDDKRSYALTPCLTIDEAVNAMKQGRFDALIIDNKLPPFRSFLEPYELIKRGTGYAGPTIVVSADTTVPELDPVNMPGDEVVIDKAELSDRIRRGLLEEACYSTLYTPLPSSAAREKTSASHSDLDHRARR